MNIWQASTEQDFVMSKTLIVEYALELGVDLSFQDFDTEINGLPGKYAPPSGSLLLGGIDGSVDGIVGVRKLDDSTCEMKRMYVRPSGRGTGLGRRLAQSIIQASVDLGYSTMVLDTLKSLESALSLYRQLGFTEIDPYYDNPHEDVVFLSLDLTAVEPYRL